VQLVYEFVRSRDPLCTRLRAEFGLTRLLNIARHFLGPDAVPDEAWFEHPAPAYAAEYARIFRGRERFGRPCTGFWIPRGLLDAGQLYHDERLFEVLKGQADQWLARIDDGDGAAGRIRQLIVQHYPAVRPEMDCVARRLGMSERSLRRRLRSEGVGFHDVVHQAMGQLARAMLREPASTIRQTAYRLGFADVSSFHRAYKRWTGRTPSEDLRS
jgi:AraC-like DNA-binding protein